MCMCVSVDFRRITKVEMLHNSQGAVGMQESHELSHLVQCLALDLALYQLWDMGRVTAHLFTMVSLVLRCPEVKVEELRVVLCTLFILFSQPLANNDCALIL